MKHRFPRFVFSRLVLPTLLFAAASAYGATFQWANTTGNWNDPANWGGVSPSGLDATDILSFGGNVGLLYVSTNNLAPVPALFNQLVFDADNTGNSPSSHTINGSPIALGGNAPQIVQNNAGGFTINAALEMRAPLVLSGSRGTVTINYTISGAFDIAKNGGATFRFGTQAAPSANTWMGRLTINGGKIGFDNDSLAGRTALRGNPITLNSPTAALTVSSELRVGALSGDSGLIESQVIGANFDNENIVIHALADGTYGGTLRLGDATGSGKATGTLIIRGVGRQTLTGTFVSPDSPPGANALQIQKDVAIGHGATLSLAGNASLAQQVSAGAIIMAGGTFELDNSVTNNPNRLRDGDSGSTGLDSAGGGLFSFIGNVTGTAEIMARLQLGSPSNARSGALTVRVTHNAGTSAATELMLQSLSRDGFAPTFSTVDFSAVDGNGAELALGQSGAAPRISFITPAPVANGLLRNTRNFNEATVGWATVNGSAFATHGANGIAPVTLNATPAGDTPGDPTANVQILGYFTASNPNGYALNSLRLEPSADGQSFALSTAGNLNTNAILLAGARDYTILATGGGGLAGLGSTPAAARYIHVESATLTISARIDLAFLNLVKAGEGTLALTGPNNNAFSTTVINAGILRATPGVSLPIGELRFRGGVLEIMGGGTFSRAVGRGAGAVNWAGIDDFGQPVDQDEGSGGFAAVGSDATIDFGQPGPTLLSWEDQGFVNSGHALIFGSRTADHRITWSDQLSLSSANGIVNYNAREIRVTDNVASATDVARFAGPIFGNVQNDLLKTGAGLLELTAINGYLGATLVQEGTLLVNTPGKIDTSFLTEVRNGATLGGNGTVGALKVASGGRLAPGANVTDTAILSSGNVTLDGAGAQFSIQIGDTVAGTTFDQLAVTGNVALNGGDLVGSLINGFAPLPGDLFFIITNDNSDAVSGTFAQGNMVFFDNAPFEIGYTGDVQTLSFTGGNDVVLRFIPEPATAGLTAGGVALVLLRRRRV